MCTKRREEAAIIACATNIHYSKKRKAIYMGERDNLLNRINPNKYREIINRGEDEYHPDM